MAILRLLPNAQHFREFVNDPVTGHHYTATCGETGLATAMVCSSPKTETLAETINLMTAVTREMMSLGWADSPNGATTTARLHQEAERRGFTIASPYDQWQDPIPSDTLHSWLRQYAGVKPIVLMATNGQAFHSIDGGHDEVGLHGHFVCVVGIADEGYVCNDGDNNLITDHLVIYPWSSVEAAHITGFLMLEMQEGIVGVPAGWKDDGTTLTAPNGQVVVKGFRNFILANAWSAENWPIIAEFASDSIEPGNPSIGAGSRQDFRFGSLGWTTSKGVYNVWVGQDVVAQRGQIVDLNGKLAAANGKLDAVRKAVA